MYSGSPSRAAQCYCYQLLRNSNSSLLDQVVKKPAHTLTTDLPAGGIWGISVHLDTYSPIFPKARQMLPMPTSAPMATNQVLEGVQGVLLQEPDTWAPIQRPAARAAAAAAAVFALVQAMAAAPVPVPSASPGRRVQVALREEGQAAGGNGAHAGHHTVLALVLAVAAAAAESPACCCCCSCCWVHGLLACIHNRSDYGLLSTLR